MRVITAGFRQDRFRYLALALLSLPLFLFCPNLQISETTDHSQSLGEHLAIRSLLPKRAEKQDSRRRHTRSNSRQNAQVFQLSPGAFEIGKPVVVYATDVSIGGMGFDCSNQIPADFFYVKLQVSQQSVHRIA